MNKNEDAIKLEMRLNAIEYLLCQLWVNILKNAGATEEKFDESSQAMLAHLKTQTFPGLDPGWSDLAAGELEEAVARLVGMQREMLGFPKKSKAGPDRS
jgi:hypothetical protein